MNLDELYKQIPSMKCKEGCTDCCGQVPFSDEEWSRIKDKRESDSMKCVYSLNGGCSIYENRPFVCRIFGTTKDIPELECPHSCKPIFPLPAERGEGLTLQYFGLGKAELRTMPPDSKLKRMLQTLIKSLWRKQ